MAFCNLAINSKTISEIAKLSTREIKYILSYQFTNMEGSSSRRNKLFLNGNYFKIFTNFSSALSTSCDTFQAIYLTRT